MPFDQRLPDAASVADLSLVQDRNSCLAWKQRSLVRVEPRRHACRMVSNGVLAAEIDNALPNAVSCDKSLVYDNTSSKRSAVRRDVIFHMDNS